MAAGEARDRLPDDSATNPTFAQDLGALPADIEARKQAAKAAFDAKVEAATKDPKAPKPNMKNELLGGGAAAGPMAQQAATRTDNAIAMPWNKQGDLSGPAPANTSPLGAPPQGGNDATKAAGQASPVPSTDDRYKGAGASREDDTWWLHGMTVEEFQRLGGELSTHPTEYCWLGREPVVGCGHLRCSVCGQIVKQKPGYLIPGQLAAFGSAEWRQRVDALYDIDDWDELAFLQHEPTYRLYVCRCGPVEESFERALSMTSVDGNPEGGNPIPWTCQGHPVVTLPAVVSGVSIPDEAALADLVRRALGGRLSPPPDDVTASAWPRRLLDRLAGGAAEQTIKDAARAALRDSDVDVRVGAIELFRSVPDAQADAILWTMAKELPSMQCLRDRRGVAIDVALAETFAKMWAGGLLEGDEPRDFVRRQATTIDHGPAVIPSIAKRDVEWLREHYQDVVRANPRCAALVVQELFNALAYSGFPIEDVAHRIAAIPGVSREQLRHEISRVLFGDARQRVLNAIGTAPLH